MNTISMTPVIKDFQNKIATLFLPKKEILGEYSISVCDFILVSNSNTESTYDIIFKLNIPEISTNKYGSEILITKRISFQNDQLLQEILNKGKI